MSLGETSPHCFVLCDPGTDIGESFIQFVLYSLYSLLLLPVLQRVSNRPIGEVVLTNFHDFCNIPVRFLNTQILWGWGPVKVRVDIRYINC